MGVGVSSGPAVPDDSGPRLDFAFNGLPLTEVIKFVQSRYHEKAADKGHLNVIIPEHLRELSETNSLTLEVKQVTVGELFNLIGLASERTIRFVNGYQYIGSGPVAQFSQAKGGYHFAHVPSAGANPTYLLQSDFPTSVPEVPGIGMSLGGGAAPRETRQLVKFFQLEPFLERFKIEDVVTAVKTGWELAGIKPLPTLRFHDETKLLAVSGDQYSLQLVEEVLSGLSNGIINGKRRPQPGMPQSAPPAPPRQLPSNPNLPLPADPAKP